MTLIACASDLHGKLSRVKWPKADILVLAGDILPNFSHSKDRDAFMQRQWLYESFAPIIHGLLRTYDSVIMTPGNHDRIFQMDQPAAREAIGSIKNFHLLIDESVEIDGIKFYGSPWTPWFGGNHWAFNLPDRRENLARARAHARNCWHQIPLDTDVLITHGPPYEILDNCGPNVGCKWLRKRLDKLDKLKVHIFGHIHEGYGQIKESDRLFVNAATCNHEYKPVNSIQVVEI